MNLQDLQENNFSKLTAALNEVFGLDFNFDAEPAKLKKISETTAKRIVALKESGVDVTHKDYQKLLLVQEGIKSILKKENTMKLNESQDLDQAEVLLAAKQMADDLQKMAEDLASMQVEELMSITNAMKEEVGTAEAEAFNATAESAIASALEAVKAANDQVSNAALVAQGQEPATDMGMDMDAEIDVDADFDIDAGIDDEEGDEFAGADAADELSDETGREMKEDAYLSAIKMVKEAQRDGKVSSSLLKKAFAQIKA